MSLDCAVISPLMIEGLIVRVPSSGKPMTSAFAPEDGTDDANADRGRTRQGRDPQDRDVVDRIEVRDLRGDAADRHARRARHDVRVRHHEVWRDEEPGSLVRVGTAHREDLDDLARRPRRECVPAELGRRARRRNRRRHDAREHAREVRVLQQRLQTGLGRRDGRQRLVEVA